MKLEWYETGARFFESGLDRGVLYPGGARPGVAWMGLVSVAEANTGGDAIPYYLDGILYRNRASAEEFAATLDAFSHPSDFLEFDGMTSNGSGLIFTLQPRKSFGLSYRTRIGDDIVGLERGYNIHLLYNVIAAPSARTRTTLSDSAEPIVFSWALSAQPLIFSDRKPTPHLIIDSRRCDPLKLAELESVIYGTSTTDPRLPMPDEIISILES